MIRSRIVNCILILVTLASFLQTQSGAAAQSQRDADDAADAVLRLSQFEAVSNAPALYTLMHSDAKAIVPKSAIVGWYEFDYFPLDPQATTSIVSVEFVDWTWEVNGRTYHNTAEVILAQMFGYGETSSTKTETVWLVQESGLWRWFFGETKEFVDQQIARFPEQESESSDRAFDQDPPRAPRSSSDREAPPTPQPPFGGCSLVELFPGYPMYRGVLTGMLANWGGLGDWACLEDLQRTDPSFDIDAENQANLDAARQLGINGQPEDWLWENWMQIEATRGLPSQCYSCVLLGTGIVPITTSVQVDQADPRILVGLWNGWESYVYRALGFMGFGSQIPNAPELLSALISIQESGGAYLTGPDAVAHGLAMGGYTYVPGTIGVDDQEFLMSMAYVAPTPYVPGALLNAQLSLLNEGTTEWRASRLQGDRSSLREFLVEFYEARGIDY